jgi:tetratricopeptide (TPR) repeat protein
MDAATIADNLFSSMMPGSAQYDSISNTILGRALDLYTSKEYGRSIPEFRRAIAMSPYSSYALDAFGYLADAYDKSGKTSEAIQTYKQAIRVFPTDDSIHLKYGNLLYGQGKYAEAVEQYRTAVNKNSSSYDNVYSLGEGYLAQGNYSNAVDQFNQAIKLAPKNSGGHYGLGKTYHKMGKLTEAVEQFQKAISLKTDLYDAHYELGVVYTEQKQTRKAASELDILKDKSSALYTQLDHEIIKITSPRIRTAYSAALNLTAPPRTKVSDLSSSLSASGASKDYAVNFIFDKDMDVASVMNVLNWNISRSSQTSTGGLYNWGLKIPETEIKVAPIPKNVVYDPASLTAKVTITITQNKAANGTIDLSHLVFSFQGKDAFGNSMDPTADQYNEISEIV